MSNKYKIIDKQWRCVETLGLRTSWRYINDGLAVWESYARTFPESAWIEYRNVYVKDDAE